MHFVDAHHHLWIPQQVAPDLGYGWLRDIGSPKPFGDPTPIQRDYEWPEFVAESREHRLAGSVYVQVDGAIADPLAESRWVQGVFAGTGRTHAIVCLADLAHEHAAARLEAQLRVPQVRGVRQILARSGRPAGTLVRATALSA